LVKLLRKLPLGRPGKRWSDNLKRGLRKMGFEYGSWVDWLKIMLMDRF